MKSKAPLTATDVDIESSGTTYPEPFAALMQGRVKRKLGDFFGLQNFGINLTELLPGGISALKHHHLRQDEFIYILSGRPTLIIGDEETLMNPGECFGIRHATGIGCQLVNCSSDLVTYLEIGDRSAGDLVEYPDDDLVAHSTPDGRWTFSHKDGRSY